MNSQSIKKRTRHVLLVEDNPDDAKLTRLAFDRVAPECHILHARDGLQALQVLRQEGSHGDGQVPDLVLLDLNMPRKGGHEVLTEIKKDCDLSCIPVVVLTTSNSDVDVFLSYSERANAYMVKPMEFDGWLAMVECLVQFWFRLARLPTSSEYLI